MIPSTSKATIGILALGSLTLAAFMGVAYWRINAHEREAQVLISEAQEKASEQTAFQSLRSLQITAKSDIDAFEKVAFTEDKLVSVIETLESAGTSLGAHVTIASVDKVTSEKKGQGQAGLRLVVEATGPWKSVYELLLASENLPYRLTVEGVDMSREVGIWHGRFTLFFPTFNN